MIITQAKLSAVKDMIKGKRMIFYIRNDKIEPDEYLRILQAEGMNGWLTFSEDKLKSEIEAVMKNRKIGVNEEGKSKSELLRGKLFTLWQNCYQGDPDFEKYYNLKMDGFIKSIQQTIDEIEINRMDDYYTNKNLLK